MMEYFKKIDCRKSNQFSEIRYEKKGNKGKEKDKTNFAISNDAVKLIRRNVENAAI